MASKKQVLIRKIILFRLSPYQGYVFRIYFSTPNIQEL